LVSTRIYYRFFFNLKLMEKIGRSSQPTRVNVFREVEHYPLKQYTRLQKPRDFDCSRSAHLDIKTFDRHIKKLNEKGYVEILEGKPKTYRLTKKAIRVLIIRDRIEPTKELSF